MLEYFLSFLILTGAIFTFIGSLGLVRLKDLYTRLHGPTKATTLGVGCLLIASAVFFSTRGTGLSLHETLITLFLFITAPVSAHMLAKAALHLNLKSLAKIPKDTPPAQKEAAAKTLTPTQTQDHAAALKTEKSESAAKADPVAEPARSEPAPSDTPTPNKTQ